MAPESIASTEVLQRFRTLTRTTLAIYCFSEDRDDLADLIAEIDRAGAGVQHHVPRKR